MLRGLYAPSEFLSTDKAPSISVDRKLAFISHSPVVLRHGDGNVFTVSLPFIGGAFLSLGSADRNESLHAYYVDIGDKALYGHGLGSRLIRGACRYAFDRDDRVRIFSSGWSHLGLLNTAIRVFGEENVAAIQGDARYGWQGQQPLDKLLDDFPLHEGEAYIVGGIEANIDSALALTWEKPVEVPGE